MKANRRAVLKGLIAGAAGIAGLGFANKARAKAIHSMAAAKSKYPTEPSKYTKYGNWVFVSGMGCYEGEATIQNHTTVAMRDLKKALEEAGSSMDKVVKCVVYIDDIGNYNKLQAYTAAFTSVGARTPARSCIAIPKGGIPGGSLIKVEAIAHV